jgi:poly-D-alanine transfer protein DltD
MGKAIRVAIAAYKKYRYEENLKKRYFALSPDYNFLKSLLNAMAADSQRLKFVIKSPNGMVVEICRDEPKPQRLKDPYVEEVVP